MTREFSPGGVPGINVVGYCARRAEGETGLLLTEGVGMDHAAAVDSPNIPMMHGAAALAGWRRVVERVHAAGGLIFSAVVAPERLKECRTGRRRPSCNWAGLPCRASSAPPAITA